MKKLEKVFDIIGEILAVLLVIVYVLWILNTNFNFLPDPVMTVVSFIKEWGALILIAIVGMEAMCKRAAIFRIIFYLLVAVIVVFMFFPNTWNAIIGSFQQ